jgi:23S rRNA pseudouridine1911/1915/1917 synthase
MLRRGEVRVNGAVAKPSTRARKGDEVVIELCVATGTPERESDEGLVVLYEDDHLLAVDKPSGMACHPVGRIRHGTLINRLHARYRSEAPGRDVVPRLAHRLDRDTSGVVLCVKHREADRRATDLFTLRRVRKTYLAIVRGVPARPAGRIEAPLGADPAGETALHQRVCPDGYPATTDWSVARAFRRHALLELHPLTGRTHQLRVHLAHLGHPIVADHLYGDLRPLHALDEAPHLPAAEETVLLGRLALHAHRIELPHPLSGEPLSITSPIPPDLAGALGALERLQGQRA